MTTPKWGGMKKPYKGVKEPAPQDAGLHYVQALVD
jgi:hypothetical protein